MPRITISEKDLTINNQVDVTENVAYIPGMAYGLELGPKLYRTVDQFIADYGNKAYKFKDNQTYTDTNATTIIGANEYERSYIYAVELLNAGLPIIFDNIRSLNDYKDKANDSGLLQQYYDRLIDGTVTSDSFIDDKTTITPGVYDDNTYTEGNTYRISKTTQNYRYQVVGNVEHKDADASLGMPAGYRFDVKLSYDGITSKSELPDGEICTVAVSNGTTNVYNKDAFEDDGSLITVVNVTKNSEVRVEIKWAEEITRMYVFTFNTCILGDNKVSAYNNILDRWSYNIKFITSGGYPVLLSKDNKYPIPETMLMAATYRGDVEALIDDLEGNGLIASYNKVNEIFSDDSFIHDFNGETSNACNLIFKANENRQAEDTRKYGNVITPGGIYYIRNNNLINQDIATIRMPGSYAYLLSLTNSVKILKNPDYFAIAGVSRGQVPNIASLINEPTGAEAEQVQDREGNKISINPILYVQNYDYCIWGNRTLFPNPLGDLAASSFANIRVMSADVKKVIYQACKELTFETNGVELWLKFKAKVEPLLEQMVANGALESFDLLRKNTTQKATLAVYVSLVTEFAVEDFDITIGLTDATVEEVE